MAKKIFIPKGLLSTSDDQEAARKRRELRERLLRGEAVKVTSQGPIQNEDNHNQPAITVPEGKLASFYWYENDPKLLRDEKKAMRKFFPQFSLDKLGDKRLYWYGSLKTDLRPNGLWYLQAIYDHNHPNNSNYGGSIKVYSIEPDLEDYASELGGIPHILRDSNDHIYICTARSEDVRAGNVVTSAASSLAWAVKWISAFELWMAGDLTTSEFSGHRI